MSFLDRKLLSIGHVENKMKEICIPLKDNDLKCDPDVWARQKSKPSTSKIIINEEFEECLDGIDDFSHLIVIYLTYTPEKARRTVKKSIPQAVKRFH